MNSPCGHANATCVVGNFWTCSTCDGVPGTKDVMASIGIVDKYKQYQREFAGRWNPTKPAVDMPFKLDLEGAIAATLPEVLKPIQDKLKADFGCPPGAVGNVTMVIDPWTGDRTAVRRNRQYAVLSVDPSYSPSLDLLQQQLMRLAKEVDRGIRESAQSVSHHRGWADYHLITLGDLPHHAVSDDHRVLRRVDTGLELVLRAYFVVAPGKFNG